MLFTFLSLILAICCIITFVAFTSDLQDNNIKSALVNLLCMCIFGVGIAWNHACRCMICAGIMWRT